jgi:hypothetical protein
LKIFQKFKRLELCYLGNNNTQIVQYRDSLAEIAKSWRAKRGPRENEPKEAHEQNIIKKVRWAPK